MSTEFRTNHETKQVFPVDAPKVRSTARETPPWQSYDKGRERFANVVNETYRREDDNALYWGTWGTKATIKVDTDDHNLNWVVTVEYEEVYCDHKRYKEGKSPFGEQQSYYPECHIRKDVRVEKKFPIDAWRFNIEGQEGGDTTASAKKKAYAFRDKVQRYINRQWTTYGPETPALKDTLDDYDHSKEWATALDAEAPWSN